MRSTFMGLEASKRGIFTQQSGLYTVGHNISNAKTEGYTRQRVNMEATRGFPTAGLQTPKTVGHIGTGVQAGSIQRIRDEFTDRQYRQETNRLGYWDTRVKEIQQVEAILHEPSDFGLNEAFKLFWQSMQDVADSPENMATRTVAIERAKHLADSFNYMDTQIKQVQSNTGKQMKVVTDEANSILSQIANLNHQIMKVEPNGYVPNDLYDARDTLVDRLNEILPVTTSRVPSGGNANAVSEGSLTVMFTPEGSKEAVVLVHGKDHAAISMEAAGEEIDGHGDFSPFEQMSIEWYIEPPLDATGNIDQVKLAELQQKQQDIYTNPEFVKKYPNLKFPVTGAEVIRQDGFPPNKGELLSLVNSYGYNTSTDPTAPVVKGFLPEMLQKLDQMAATFIEEFNKIHTGENVDDLGNQIVDANGDPIYKGYTLAYKDADGNLVESKRGENFFSGTTAKDIKVEQVILDNPANIAASSSQGKVNGVGVGTEGNGGNALLLANMQHKAFKGTDNGTIQSFYQGVTGRLGVDGQEAIRTAKDSAILQLSIANRRASVSSVSLDEEMTNMITFQQAYNANARMITVVDETLDKIINGMGRVGL